MDEESKRMFQKMISQAVDAGNVEALRGILEAAKELENTAINTLAGVRDKIKLLQAGIKELEDKDQVKIPFGDSFPKDGDKVEIDI